MTRRAAFLLPLCALLLPGILPPAATALQVDIAIDPGLPGESFATRTYDLPTLVGLPVEDAPLVIDFTFADHKHVTSTGHPGGLPPVSLVLMFDPLAPLSVADGPNGPAFFTDEFGLQVEKTALFRTYGPSNAPTTATLAIGETDELYHGMHFVFDFRAAAVAGLSSQIRSAMFSFQDTRRFVPTAPLPHTVGVWVPEPRGLAVWALAALAVVLRRSGSQGASR